jgi:hypothetical protein
VSIFERAYNWDEADSAKPVPVTLRLVSVDNLDSYSQIGSFDTSVAGTFVILALFVAIVYFVILPANVRAKLVPFTA